MPWYLALCAAIAVIVIGSLKKINIGLIMLVAALVLGASSRLSPPQFYRVLVDGLAGQITIMLMFSIVLIGMLGYVMKATGAMDEIISQLQALIANTCVIAAAIPMMVGMLSVPGGAILSAPLCEATGSKLALSPLKLAVVNNWFRHVLYFMFPLFPSLIIASKLSGVSLGLFFLHNLPLTVIGAVAGYFWLFRGCSSPAEVTGAGFTWKGLASLAAGIGPLLMTLILVVGFDFYFPFALAAGLVLAFFYRLPPEARFLTLANRFSTMLLPGIKIRVALVIAGIMVFKEMLTFTGVIVDLTALVLSLGLPVIFLVAVISFAVGLLTGDNAASIAILVPLFLPLMPQGFPVYSAYMAFLYAGSTAGHIISPAHPCFALTKEYFSADFRAFISLTLPLLGVVMVVGFAITMLFGYH